MNRNPKARLIEAIMCILSIAQITVVYSRGTAYRPNNSPTVLPRFRMMSDYWMYKKIGFMYGSDSAKSYLKGYEQRERNKSNYTDYLPLTGGTLSGALLGTSASFYTTSSNTQLILGYLPGIYSYEIGRNSSDGQLHFYGNQTGYTGYVFEGVDGVRLSISPLGNMTLNGYGSSSVLTLNRPSTTYSSAFLFQTNSSSDWFMGTNAIATNLTNFYLYKYGIGTVMDVSSSTGAITFSNKLGINGAASTYPLTVANASNGTTAAFGGTSYGIRIDNSGTYSNGRSTIFGVDNTFYASYQPLGIEASALYLNSITGGAITLGGGLSGTSATFSDNVGIGTSSPSEKLSVNGNIKSKKLIVTQTGWGDYVFKPTYQLKSLTELEQYIKERQHLPELPTENEVKEKGVDIGDTQVLLLKKIEELTLYLIEQNKKIEEQGKLIRSLQSQLNQQNKK